MTLFEYLAVFLSIVLSFGVIRLLDVETAIVPCRSRGCQRGDDRIQRRLLISRTGSAHAVTVWVAAQLVASDRRDVLYFAYGSNLCLRRMRGRAPSARRVAAVMLPGYALTWSKKGVDGSGKCTIAVSPKGAIGVRGVLYRLPVEEKAELDVVEGLGTGYDEASVTVETPAGPREATTYVAAATHVDASLTPYSWYRDLVAAGAVEAGLPDDYVRRLATAEAQPDPDAHREARNRADMPCEETP